MCFFLRMPLTRKNVITSIRDINMVSKYRTRKKTTGYFSIHTNINRLLMNTMDSGFFFA
jgi:hypothetical protein